MAKKKPVAAAPEKKECDHMKLLISAAVLFIFLTGYDFVVHGKLLHDLYDQTKSVWRSQEEMKALFPICLLPNALFALLFTGAYAFWRCKVTISAVGTPNCPWRKSIGFGVWLGLLMGVGMASDYLVLPIPGKLAAAWFFAGLGKGILSGIVLNAVTMNCGSCKA